jgi:hypothetical protein
MTYLGIDLLLSMCGSLSHQWKMAPFYSKGHRLQEVKLHRDKRQAGRASASELLVPPPKKKRPFEGVAGGEARPPRGDRGK